MAKDGKISLRDPSISGTTTGTTAKCAGAVTVSAKTISTSAEAICSFC